MPTRRNVKSDADIAADAHERRRDYLGLAQIGRLLAAAKAGRHGPRDHLLVLMMFRHGLRVSEAISLRRDHVDLAEFRLWVPRLKQGLSVEHPVDGDELRAIRRWLGQRDDRLPWLFVSERAVAAHPAGRKLHPRNGRETCRSRSCPPPHASSLLWLRARQSGLRPAADPRLPWPP